MKILLLGTRATHPVLARLLAAAQGFGAEIEILVATPTQAAQAARLTGARRIHLLQKNAALPELAHALAAQLNGFTQILAAADTADDLLLAQLAARLNQPAISQVCTVQAPDTVTRTSHSGAFTETLYNPASIGCYGIETSVFLPVQEQSLPVEIIELVLDFPDQKQRTTPRVKIKAESLSEARVVIGGGKGLGAAFQPLLQPLAATLNATIGASRNAIEAGLADPECQIGQTGKKIAPELYLAVGISGAAQHVAGIRASKTIIAINRDPDAPIFKVADYGLVGDALSVLPLLQAQLRKRVRQPG